MYARGLGCEVDYAEARRWYAAAAEQAIRRANLALVSFTRMASGSKIDLPTAASWYEKAAAQGNADAQTALALMCDAGAGRGARSGARPPRFFNRRRAG